MLFFELKQFSVSMTNVQHSVSSKLQNCYRFRNRRHLFADVNTTRDITKFLAPNLLWNEMEKTSKYQGVLTSLYFSLSIETDCIPTDSIWKLSLAFQRCKNGAMDKKISSSQFFILQTYRIRNLLRATPTPRRHEGSSIRGIRLGSSKFDMTGLDV